MTMPAASLTERPAGARETAARPPLSPVRAALYGGLAVGILDAFDAIFFFGSRGVSPLRIFQSVASGLLGHASYEGGVPTALLGVVCHFTVALCIATVYVAASRRWQLLARRPLPCGLLFGVIAYGVMNWVVLPLSAATHGGGTPPLPVLVNGVLGHALLVGLPPAWFAHLAGRD